ncbi:hypothetical protein [Actinomadura sp. LOL_011]|uniref:hypothetical protein n=1 Tax=Actinomadura sp. LOL_011 TaxID=3345410 RepID=UPI003A7FEEE5
MTAVAVAELATVVAAWWSEPTEQAAAAEAARSARLEPLPFAARGIVPMGYAAFAFALGVTFGVVVRRTLPAMAITTGVFAVLSLGLSGFLFYWVRRRLS